LVKVEPESFSFDMESLGYYFGTGHIHAENMKNTDFIEKLKGTIRRFDLLKKGDRILVALSGGPDSVALLHALLAIRHELCLKLSVAHLNHKLRGSESDEDERFAKKLASRLKLRFFSKRVDVKREAKKRKASIEEAARDVRYRYLQKLALQIRADKIAVGHHADDQAETFLMRLLRGAGGAGLSGIPPKRGKIIRPLIQIRREEIETFLKANKIPYRLDSSNYLADHFRNKIRLSLLPKIREDFNPRIVESLNRTADIISLQQEYIEERCEQILRDIGISGRSRRRRAGRRRMALGLEQLAGYDTCLQREMIRLSVKELKGDLNQLSFESVDRALKLICQKKSGRKVRLANRIWVELSGKELVFYEGETKGYDYPLTLPGEVNLREWGVKMTAEILGRKPVRKSLLHQSQNVAFLDWEKLKAPFRLRTRKRGDKFRPLGMKGTKSLADFLIDAKVPRHLRDEVAILTSNDRIVWVVGYRVSDEFRVSGNSRKVLKLKARL
jgi:tRNA(Ile)-lysidine synthase